MNNLLIIMVKDPIPGQVKTRLAATIGNDNAAYLAMCFIVDLYFRFRDLPQTDLRIAYSPEGAQDRLTRILPGQQDFWAQPAGDLGHKINSAFEQGFADGYRKITVIGSDCLILTRWMILESFEQLEHKPVVLGPALDNGYYLVSLTAPRPELFEDIPWSTPQVWEQTTSKLQHLELACHLLPKLFDIDTIADIEILWDEMRVLDADMRPANTYLAVQKLLKIEGADDC